MILFKYIVAAFIQGITEPLPISSSGHMKLFSNLFAFNIFNDLNFEIICNFGSFIAIFLIYRKDICLIIKDFISYIFNKKTKDKTKSNFKYALNIIISTIPIVISTIFLKNFLEEKLSNMMFLAFSFFITSIMLYLIRKKNGNKKDSNITIKEALFIGLFQSFAIFPGISRSGIVLIACLLCNLDRKSSIKYTFLLYFPVSIGALIFSIPSIINSNLSLIFWPYLIGLIISCVITFFSYEWMTNWVKKGKFQYFSIYCLILSLFILFWFY